MGKRKPEVISENPKPGEFFEVEGTLVEHGGALPSLPPDPQEPEQAGRDIITALQADNLRLSRELGAAKVRIDKLAHVVLQNWGTVI